MRTSLIVFAFALVSTMSCRTEANEATPPAPSWRSKALKEGLIAANAYYAKSTKDCGSYRYAWGSNRSVVAYKDAAKDANVEIVAGPNPYEGLEWRVMASLKVKAYSQLGWSQRINGWVLGDGIPGEGVMIEKKKGQITYYDDPLSTVTSPGLDCQ